MPDEAEHTKTIEFVPIPRLERHTIASDERARILIVDDVDINREILHAQLVSLGHLPLQATDGNDALVKVRKEPPDLVLLDIQMPVMDGYQLLEQLKSDKVLRGIPVIMLSSVDEVESVVKCIQLGAEDYLTKPCNLVLLETRINRSLERRRAVLKAQRFGQYRLEKKIGEGGMAEVYLASHEMLRRPTALKILRRSALTERRVRLFEREVQMTCRLSHPNTVKLFDYGQTDTGHFYYAMEFLDGVNLRGLCNRFFPLPEARVLHFLMQVCESLREAHGIGLIHRDIKPANIMVCKYAGLCDVVKVLDFGIVQGPEGQDEEDRGRLIGSPSFMSPECAMRSPILDYRSDLYSVGAVAYFLVTGKLLFDHASPRDQCEAQICESPVPPSRKTGRPLSANLEKLIMQCLEKDPNDRPQSARELHRAFSECSEAGKWTEEDAEVWYMEHSLR